MEHWQFDLFIGFIKEYLMLLSPIASGLAILLGMALLKKPTHVIRTQMQFYRIINWKMEPVSWDRELRNTRLMGLIAVLAGLTGLIAIVFFV